MAQDGGLLPTPLPAIAVWFRAAWTGRGTPVQPPVFFPRHSFPLCSRHRRSCCVAGGRGGACASGGGTDRCAPSPEAPRRERGRSRGVTRARSLSRPNRKRSPATSIGIASTVAHGKVWRILQVGDDGCSQRGVPHPTFVRHDPATAGLRERGIRSLGPETMVCRCGWPCAELARCRLLQLDRNPMPEVLTSDPPSPSGPAPPHPGPAPSRPTRAAGPAASPPAPRFPPTTRPAPRSPPRVPGSPACRRSPAARFAARPALPMTRQ